MFSIRIAVPGVERMSEVSLPPQIGLAGREDWALRAAMSEPETIYHFGGFRCSIGSRTLELDGQAVELGSRAFDLLVVLLQARGRVVSKNEITNAVWPSTTVDESNLRFQMACLRKALGSFRDAIKTVQGRGYLFVAETVKVLEPIEMSPPVPQPVRDGAPLVAVVEDDENTREALDGLLRSCGFIAETYPDTRSLIATGRADQVECLVLDVWLPGQSGLDFQASLKDSGIDVPIVFISGHADVHMSVRAMKAGAVEFLTKPVRHQDLLEAIDGAVAARRARA